MRHFISKITTKTLSTNTANVIMNKKRWSRQPKYLMMGMADLSSWNPGTCSYVNTEQLANPFAQISSIAFFPLNGSTVESINNYQTTSVDVTYGSGKFGNAVVLNGTTSYIQTTEEINVGTVFTYSFWVNPGTASTANNPILNHGWNVGQASRMGVYMNSSAATLQLLVGTDGVWRDLKIPKEDKWHHIAIVCRGGSYDAYVDTEMVINSIPTSIDLKGLLALGKYSSSAAYRGFGKIERIRIFNTELYHTHIISLYNEKVISDTTVCDQFWSKTQLLIKADGLDGERNNTIKLVKNESGIISDISPTVTGMPAIGTVSPYDISKNGASCYFNGSSYMSISPTNVNLNFRLEDFTIEGWVYLTALNKQHCILNTGAYNSYQVSVFISDTNKFGFYFNDGAIVTLSNSTLTLNTWYHFALCRTSGVVNLFVNGVLDKANIPFNHDINSNTSTLIGTDSVNSLSGYISDLRVIKGQALYSEHFNVPYEPLQPIQNTVLLTSFNEAKIKDSSNHLNIVSMGNAQISETEKIFGSGSIFFDGSGDYLHTTTTNNEFAFGLFDFTIELWCKMTELRSWISFASFSNPEGILIGFQNSSGWGITIDYNGSGNYIKTDTGFTTDWQHIAVVRKKDILTVYVNGINKGSGSLAGIPINNSKNLRVAESNFSGWLGQFAGYIAELRITKGVARYTENFIPANYPAPTQGL